MTSIEELMTGILFCGQAAYAAGLLNASSNCTCHCGVPLAAVEASAHSTDSLDYLLSLISNYSYSVYF